MGPFRFFRRWLAEWRRSGGNQSSARRSVRLVVEAMEERLTPSAGVQEQYMLALINRFRQNPAGELALILNANDANVNNDLNYFRVDQNVLAMQLRALPSAPPLAWNDLLASSALSHSQTMLAAQSQAHQVAGEADPWTRMANAGYANSSYLAENIFAFAKSTFEAEASFAIDWGINPPTGIQSPTGHRDNLLSTSLREVGVGLVNAPSGSSMGPMLFTQDFGDRTTIGNPFVLGSIFADANGDGSYNPGEGLSGITVTLSGTAGTFHTTDTAAGGYQIQVPAGTYQITASGGSLSAPLTQTVIVGSSNVLVDFLKPLPPAPPTLNGPPASATDTTPTFSWNAVSGATAYDLWVDNSTTGKSQVIRNQTLPTNSFTPTTPLATANYRAWVRVTTASGTSAWSAANSFTIAAPAIPTLTAPTGSTTNLTPTFSWTLSAGATNYDLWVTNNTTHQDQIIRQQSLSTNSYTPTTALPLGSYTAWVRAYNGSVAQGAWSAPLNFGIVAPSPPTVNGPATTTSTTPTFTWTPSTGASNYDIWADNTTTKQSQVVRATVTTTSYTPANPIPRGQYTVWVRAGNNANPIAFGPWSAAYRFLIDTTAPAISTINAPAGPTSDLTPTIGWTLSAGATRYDLWVDNRTTGQSQVIRQQNLTANSFTPATNLTVGTYTAWVQAYDNTNQTRGWSAGYSFTITAPAAPTQLAPVGSTTNTTPTFTWAVVADATRYDLWVDNRTTGQSQVIRQQALPTNSFTPPTALAKGSYRFWVRAINAKGNAGSWSAAADMTIV